MATKKASTKVTPAKKEATKAVESPDPKKVKKVTATNEQIAKAAYDKMRKEIAGSFPDWDDLEPNIRKNYEDGAEHCRKHSPRTRYEQIVLEVIKHG